MRDIDAILSSTSEVNVVTLKPGQILVVKINHPIAPEINLRTKSILREILDKSGYDNEIIVTDNSVNLEIIDKGD